MREPRPDSHGPRLHSVPSAALCSRSLSWTRRFPKAVDHDMSGPSYLGMKQAGPGRVPAGGGRGEAGSGRLEGTVRAAGPGGVGAVWEGGGAARTRASPAWPAQSLARRAQVSKAGRPSPTDEQRTTFSNCHPHADPPKNVGFIGKHFQQTCHYHHIELPKLPLGLVNYLSTHQKLFKRIQVSARRGGSCL